VLREKEFKFRQRRGHFGSNDNGWPRSANESKRFLRGVCFGIHNQIRSDCGGAALVTDLAVDVNDSVARSLIDEFRHLAELLRCRRRQI
jgi:hypothetical protein